MCVDRKTFGSTESRSIDTRADASMLNQADKSLISPSFRAFAPDMTSLLVNQSNDG